MAKQLHIHIHRKTSDAGNFEESKHPRAENGQFGSGGGGSSAVKSATLTKKPASSASESSLRVATLPKDPALLRSHLEKSGYQITFHGGSRNHEIMGFSGPGGEEIKLSRLGPEKPWSLDESGGGSESSKSATKSAPSKTPKEGEGGNEAEAIEKHESAKAAASKASPDAPHLEAVRNPSKATNAQLKAAVEHFHSANSGAGQKSAANQQRRDMALKEINSRVKAHSQYSKADHDYLTEKGWSPGEILERWDQEAKRGVPAQQTNKLKPPSMFGPATGEGGRRR